MDEREFEQATRRAAEQVEHLTDDGVRRAEKILTEMRDQLLVKLASGPTEYGEWYYNQLLQDVARLEADLKARYTEELHTTLDKAAEQVEKTIDVPLDRAGLTVDLPRASRQVVEMLTGYSPGQLIGGLSQDGRKLIQSELRQGLLGVKTPWQIQQTIAGQLTEAGPFRTIAARAEAIWRTEASRVFNVLAEERYKRIEQKHPGRMKKQWLHSGNVANPRPHHAALDGQTVGIDEKFLVAGIAVDGPHDPALPASETIRCGCTTILVLNNNYRNVE